MQKHIYKIQKNLRSSTLLLAAVALSVALVLPILTGGNKTYAAGQLTSRSVSISTGSNAASAATTQYIFSFKPTVTTAINAVQIDACQTALGTCTIPSGFSWASATYGSISGFGSAGVFAKNTANTGLCQATANTYTLCLDRTGATAETISTAHTITMNAVQNPTATPQTYFFRITTYSANTYTLGVSLDLGTVATSTTQTLTINAAVQEILSFCVGATTVDDATTSPGATCTNINGSSVNMGTLDSAAVSVTPVLTNGGSSTNGIAMLRTNAVNGATVSYKAVLQSGTNHQGTLRVAGQACNPGSVSTDPCIDAQGGTQGAFVAGTEKFGMTIAGTNCGSTGPSYTCALTSGTNNLEASSNYIGATTTSYGVSAGYAWVEGGTATQIASSTTVVDDEALILKFAATPSITTPTGSYTAQADFIAVATY